MLKKLFSLEGKVALVTGGSSGIGGMISEGLVSAGAKVYIVARNVEKGVAKAKELSQMGQCEYIEGDLSSIAGIEAVVAEVQGRESKLDILVNNAGLLTLESIDEVTEAGWDGPMNTNLKAVFFLIQKSLPLLRAAGSEESPARIINIGSAAGSDPADIEYYSYCASKAGVHHLTRALAHRLAADHINVNAIAPGVFPTDIGYEPPEEVRQFILNGIPLKRLGMLEDIAGSVVYLASRAGGYTTGILLPVDGGKVWA